MQIITNVTVEVKEGKGRKTLAPGKHNLAEAIAKELIDGGHAVTVDGDNTNTAPAGNKGKAPSKPATTDPAGGHGGAGGSGEGGSQFDAAAFLEATIPDIASKLPGLSAEQLDALAAAEQEREKPRVGVIEAIAEAKQGLAQ